MTKDIVRFKELFGDEYPPLASLISSHEDIYKKIIVDHLKSGTHIAESPGRVVDIITGEPIGIPLSMLSDGVYSWRSDMIYYYEKYNLELNQDFVDHVLKM